MNIPFDVVTFDCYGTLIDWEAGIAHAFLAAAREDGVELEAEDVLRTYAEVEAEIESAPYRPYRQVLQDAALATATRLAWSISPARATFLAESLPDWEPFPDTNRALERLADEGYRLGILSNVDDDLFAGTRRHFTVTLDPVITAEHVWSYKPATGHFTEARRRIGAARWLHAAQSYYHDIAPAWEKRIPSVWVNRRGERAGGDARPLAEVATLAELVEWLETTRFRVSGGEAPG